MANRRFIKTIETNKHPSIPNHLDFTDGQKITGEFWNMKEKCKVVFVVLFRAIEVKLLLTIQIFHYST